MNNQPILNKKVQQGATMVEVLVSILIFSVGLLGVASTQTMGLTNTQSALNRSYATQLSYDLVDIMRLNQEVVEQGAGNVFDGYITIDNARAANPLGYAITPECNDATAGCTEAQLSTSELESWRQKIVNTLPDGQAQILLTNAAENIYRVIITWQDIKTESVLSGNADAIADAVAGGADIADFQNIVGEDDATIYRFEMDFRP
jgi:type IV pilus assembly protein PilV